MLRLQPLGFKCIVLDEQLRIIPGGFDLAASVIYSHLTPIDASAYNDHPMAPYLEDFAQNYAKSLGPNHCPIAKRETPPYRSQTTGNICEMDPVTFSRRNQNTADLAVDMVIEMNSIITAFYPEDAAIISPYKEHAELIKERLEREFLDHLVDVVITDSFQGMEKPVMI
jgi:hypothetical protein